MKILNNDNDYSIINSDLINIYDKLPNGVYEMKVAPMRGYWFEKTKLEKFNSKLYGEHTDIINKIKRRYETATTNMGVLLSGPSGTGKSIISRNIAADLSNDIPVIIIKAFLGEEMLSVLTKIRGKVVVIMDEFEKTFLKDTPDDCKAPQDALLSFLDGIETKQEKLFLLTVNDLYRVNKYLLGRPGRIRYHFRMQLPTEENISEYLKDNLLPEYSTIIDKATQTLVSKTVSWDSLAAITAELNEGEDLDNTMKVLNISDYTGKSDGLEVTATFKFSDGSESSDDKYMRSHDSTISFWASHPFLPDLSYRVNISLKGAVPHGYGTYKVTNFKVESREEYMLNEEGVSKSKVKVDPNMPTIEEVYITKSSLYKSIGQMDNILL